MFDDHHGALVCLQFDFIGWIIVCLDDFAHFELVGVTAEGELVFMDDDAMVEQDLMDFLPSSESSSDSEESESSDGLVEFDEPRAPMRNRRERPRDRRQLTRRPTRHAPPRRDADSDEDEPISLETHLESGVHLILSRPSKFNFLICPIDTVLFVFRL